jgi:hypothetical protein
VTFWQVYLTISVAIAAIASLVTDLDVREGIKESSPNSWVVHYVLARVAYALASGLLWPVVVVYGLYLVATEEL